MTKRDAKEVIGLYVAAYNAFDVDGMMALLSPDVRFENYSGDTLTASATGIDEFRQLAEQARVLFSTREQRVTSLHSLGSTFVAEIAYRGRLAIDIPDGPLAGTSIELQGQSAFSIQQGRISRLVDRS